MKTTEIFPTICHDTEICRKSLSAENIEKIIVVK